jgi:hypothetical protein
MKKFILKIRMRNSVDTKIFTSDDFLQIFTRRDEKEHVRLTEDVASEWMQIWEDYRRTLKPKKYCKHDECNAGRNQLILEAEDKERRGADDAVTARKKASEAICIKQPKPPLWGHQGPQLGLFLEYVLHRNPEEEYRKDRLLLIFLTSRLRGTLQSTFKLFDKGPRGGRPKEEMRESKHLGLCWLLLQWDEQVISTCEDDALTSTLIRLEYREEHIAWAEIAHARRMRSGIGGNRLKVSSIRKKKRYWADQVRNIELKKIEISTRLLSDAERILQKEENDEEMQKGDLEQFCYIPTKFFEIYINLQKTLNSSRRGDQKDAAGRAQELQVELEKQREVEHKAADIHSLIYLKWWALHILIRASCASLDGSNFTKYAGEMKELEKGSPDDLRNYFNTFHKYEDNNEWTGRMLKDSNAESNSATLVKAIDNWRIFFEGDFDLVKREGQNPGIEWSDFCGPGEEQCGFPEIHSIAYDGPRRGKFQPLSVTRGTHTQLGKRVSQMIREIDEANFATARRNNHHSCVILEILAREIVYRIWFEVSKMPVDYFGDKWSMSLLEVQIKQAIGVLERIKKNIIEFRAFDRNSKHIFIDLAIKEFGDYHEKTKKGDMTVSKFKKQVRTLLEDYHREEKEKHPSQGVKTEIFMGIKYANGDVSMMQNQHSFLERSRP